mmetsp:Transcript_10057/g.30069  ORF Transcript_10057/g.30069 Transcript_10057/m.30069 type:complete len:269 (-) Transcript_10057:214-1020(-)
MVKGILEMVPGRNDRRRPLRAACCSSGCVLVYHCLKDLNISALSTSAGSTKCSCFSRRGAGMISSRKARASLKKDCTCFRTATFSISASLLWKPGPAACISDRPRFCTRGSPMCRIAFRMASFCTGVRWASRSSLCNEGYCTRMRSSMSLKPASTMARACSRVATSLSLRPWASPAVAARTLSVATSASSALLKSPWAVSLCACGRRPGPNSRASGTQAMSVMRSMPTQARPCVRENPTGTCSVMTVSASEQLSPSSSLCSTRCGAYV